ncbi:hypothetical protein MSPP1_001151 [Malassezia sp. CBS 17886]|nr:hypothetical protein MSPP1_001151 [Malassezia sp. CBS 17886]
METAARHLAARWGWPSRGGHLLVTNDALLLGAVPNVACPARIVVAVAGTGSVVRVLDAVGPGRLHTVATFGGLGYLLGDEGSAYGLGRSALRAVLDVRTDKDAAALRARIAAQWKLDSTECLLASVYKEGGEQAHVRVAQLASVVLACAHEGSSTARAIVKEQAQYLAAQIARASGQGRGEKHGRGAGRESDRDDETTRVTGNGGGAQYGHAVVSAAESGSPAPAGAHTNWEGNIEAAPARAASREPHRATLCLGGRVLHENMFRDMVLAALDDAACSFSHVFVNDDPARHAARMLALASSGSEIVG